MKLTIVVGVFFLLEKIVALIVYHVLYLFSQLQETKLILFSFIRWFVASANFFLLDDYEYRTYFIPLLIFAAQSRVGSKLHIQKKSAIWHFRQISNR